MSVLRCYRSQAERLKREFNFFFSAAHVPLFRSMKQFALDEIIMPPGGPKANEPFSIENQPWVGLWLDAVDSNDFIFHVLVAMVQGGKTFSGWVLPTMYYLFERQENVACGIPQKEMSYDKWIRDLKPAIMASKYRDLLPTEGIGSKGGEFDSIVFKNGAVLKFLAAKGGDATRSGVTFRILVMTEVDKYDTAGEASREGGPVDQMLARLESHPMENWKVFMECTASYETGRIWKEYTNGTASSLAVKCPKCGEHGVLERDHLKGWQEAADEFDAFDRSFTICPVCSAPWTDQERKWANANAVLIHRGQTVDRDGVVSGPAPRTFTLGFRANVLNNIIKPVGDIGVKEFKARRNPDDDENGEKVMLQFQWARPWGGETDHTSINSDIVASRISMRPQYEIPEDTESLVAQIDLHQDWHYYTVLATGRIKNPLWEFGKRDASDNLIPEYLPPHYTVVDYGIEWNPDLTQWGIEGAISEGLRKTAAKIHGRQWVTEEGRVIPFDFGQVDGGYHQHLAVAFCTANKKWRVSKGRGSTDKFEKIKYRAPSKRTQHEFPGNHWYDARQPKSDHAGGQNWWMIFADTDWWLHRVHSGFMCHPWLTKDDLGFDPKTPKRRPGSIIVWGFDDQQHLRNIDAEIHRSSFAKQILGWKWEDMKTKTGHQRLGWNKQYDQDHWLDTTYGAIVADDVFRTYSKKFRKKTGLEKPEETENKAVFGNKLADGRPYLISERQR